MANLHARWASLAPSAAALLLMQLGCGASTVHQHPPAYDGRRDVPILVDVPLRREPQAKAFWVALPKTWLAGHAIDTSGGGLTVSDGLFNRGREKLRLELFLERPTVAEDDCSRQWRWLDKASTVECAAGLLQGEFGLAPRSFPMDELGSGDVVFNGCFREGGYILYCSLRTGRANVRAASAELRHILGTVRIK